jgi:hypothetical protein
MRESHSHSAAAVAIAPRVRPAAVGKAYLVVEYKRRLEGLPRWKRAAFRMFRGLTRWCDARLGLPVIVHHDPAGDFRIDYCGVFSDRNLMFSAITKMRAERGRGYSHFGWQELDLNAVAPAPSGRYYDGDFPAAGTMMMQRANQTVRCPFNGSQCNPADTMKRSQVEEIKSLAGQLVHASTLKAKAQ